MRLLRLLPRNELQFAFALSILTHLLMHPVSHAIDRPPPIQSDNPSDASSELSPAEDKAEAVDNTPITNEPEQPPAAPPPHHVLDEKAIYVFLNAVDGSDWAVVEQTGEHVRFPDFIKPAPTPKDEPATNRPQSVLVLPGPMSETLRVKTKEYQALIADAQAFERLNPFASYDPNLISSVLQQQLRDWASSSRPSLPFKRSKQLQVIAVAKKMDKQEFPARCDVMRIVVLFPPLPQDGGLYKSGKGLRVDVLNADGSAASARYWDLSIYGNVDFREKCASILHLGKLLRPNGGHDYLTLLMQGRLEEVEEWNSGIEEDIAILTKRAAEEALDQKAMREELTGIIGKNLAKQVSSKLGKTLGPLYLSSIHDLLAGPQNEDWLSALLMYKRRKGLLADAFNQAGLLWFRGRLANIALIGVDSEKLWLMQGTFAGQLADELCGTFDLDGRGGEGLKDYEYEALKEQVRDTSSRLFTKRNLAEVVSALDTVTAQDWESSREGRLLLPKEPDRPRPPGRTRRGSRGFDPQERLDRLADLQMATGDTLGYFDTQASIGAAAALRIGDPTLISQFSPADLARARLYGAGEASESNIEYDFTDPDYLKNMVIYRDEMEKWREKKEQITQVIQKNLEKRREFAVRDLEIEYSLFSSQSEVAPSAEEQFKQFHFYVPSFRILIKQEGSQ